MLMNQEQEYRKEDLKFQQKVKWLQVKSQLLRQHLGPIEQINQFISQLSINQSYYHLPVHPQWSNNLRLSEKFYQSQTHSPFLLLRQINKNSHFKYYQHRELWRWLVIMNLELHDFLPADNLDKVRSTMDLFLYSLEPIIQVRKRLWSEPNGWIQK